MRLLHLAVKRRLCHALAQTIGCQTSCPNTGGLLAVEARDDTAGKNWLGERGIFPARSNFGAQ
jgi:hypothetical protein